MSDTILTIRIARILQVLDDMRVSRAATAAGECRPQHGGAPDDRPHDPHAVLAESRRLQAQSLELADESRRLCDAVRRTCDLSVHLRTQLVCSKYRGPQASPRRDHEHDSAHWEG